MLTGLGLDSVMLGVVYSAESSVLQLSLPSRPTPPHINFLTHKPNAVLSEI